MNGLSNAPENAAITPECDRLTNSIAAEEVAAEDNIPEAAEGSNLCVADSLPVPTKPGYP